MGMFEYTNKLLGELFHYKLTNFIQKKDMNLLLEIIQLEKAH